MKTEFDLEFSPSPAVVRTARAAASVVASRIPPRQADDIRLLVSELVTNSIRHAGLAGGDRVRVRLSMGRDKVRAEVRDRGRGFDVPSPPGSLAEMGWGMYLLDHIADRWGVQTGEATCVWFEIDV